MRIATFRLHGETRAGFVDGELVFPLAAGATTLELTQQGLAATLELGARTIAAGGGLPLRDVVLLPPIQPPAMRDFVAFEEHVEGVVQSVSGETKVGEEWYHAPTFYFTNPHTLRATGDEIAAPSGSAALDFELELAAIIGAVEGSDGRDLTPDAARGHIFGYTILNDWSARDLQRREMRVNLGPCKGKDFANTIGPWIVTADEFEALHDDEGFLPISLSVSINGVPYGQDLLSNMGWPFAELVSYASRNSRVLPGDLLGSGTTGSGCLAEWWGRNADPHNPPSLQPGDVVRMEVEGIGAIENRVVAGPTLPPVAPARSRPRNRSRSEA
ncbi:MAG: fumarylacetoacetate hydrolase family protein [Actinomycetota bacterium]|nr:fumarylacetoacetate hydrolase family protein [Actinomycetota bacterium]